ncbi:unnamed protein product [Microthlaspi erraticum]|uniref:RING-type domain-containing protein n=1 Tax=Microthlaspi erraticum TaxID=1685480 RepID=A0A6D2LL96_9BRAS|nr:unnamed protein product [Microthlaspi erraticum]
MFDDSSSHCLVGKFFANSTPPPSFSETEKSLREQWVLLSDDMTIKNLDGGDTFLFEFRQKDDKERVLETGPYYVNGVIIVIKDLNSSDVIDFTVASFFVMVVFLPRYLCTEDFLPTLQSLVGGNNPVLCGTFRINSLICFRVDVDLKKPLRPGFYVDEERQNRFVEFKYWKLLGDFCYSCGMIGHVKENCVQVTLPKERALNVTSRTHVYGPWLIFNPRETPYEINLMKSPSSVGDCEKTLSYPQFFVEVEFNRLYVCDSRTRAETKYTHRFRFPCSYLDEDAETESTYLITSSKVYEVLRREICENTLYHKPLNEADFLGSLVERLKLIKKEQFCCDDKWLTLKLQLDLKLTLTPVDYESMVACNRERLMESRISDLIKKRVEKKENLLSLSSWQDQIREAISEMGCARYLHRSYVPRRATQAMMEAVEIEISSSSCTIPADSSTVSRLERFKVLGDDMDRLEPCVICVEEMFLAEEATVLSCSHVFHSSCVGKWFQFGHKCPLCGFKLPPQK